VLEAANPRALLHRSNGDGGMPTLYGLFAVFNTFTEIDSWEGRFLERLAPGSLNRTIRERGDKVRVLFQHGGDPFIGEKPLGPLRELREDTRGGYYELPLLDTAYVRELVPGLEEGLYGASFRFKVMHESYDERPGRSAHNPEGIPERELRDIDLYELGPVTFPAYDGATAALRAAAMTPASQVAPGRRAGKGMLTPVRELDALINGRRERLRPGRDRLSLAHPLVRSRPEAFRAAAANDESTRRQHRELLENAAHQLRAGSRKLKLPGRTDGRTLRRVLPHRTSTPPSRVLP
jgi:HK97 family phage prohead protease